MVKVKNSNIGITMPQQKRKGGKSKGLSENLNSIGKNLKTMERVKRGASEMSPHGGPSKKRSAFGDITNATRQSTTIKGKKSIPSSSAAETLKSNSVDEVLSCLIQETQDSISFSQALPDLELLSSSSELSSSQESSESSQEHKSWESRTESLICETALESNDKEKSIATNISLTSASAEKVEHKIEDIDADTSDPFFVSEYANEIFLNMKARETLFPLKSYMHKQKQLTTSMRAILVDWLVEVQESFELYHETLYVGVKIMDNFLMRCPVEREQLQLVGAASLFIASKVEERHSPCLDDFLYICDDAYDQPKFIEMERKILVALDFDINIPIPYRFLRRYARAASADVQTLTLARFLLESTLHKYQFLEYKPSLLASACLYLALRMKRCGTWSPTLEHYTGYNLEELKECVLELNTMNSEQPKPNLMTVRNKYSHRVFHEVANIPPIDDLALDYK